MYGMERAKAVRTPRVRMSPEAANLAEKSPLLVGREITKYRSGVMRAAYLGQDRPDVAEACKVLARSLRQPTEHSGTELKRLIRYHVQTRRGIEIRCTEPGGSTNAGLFHGQRLGWRRTTSA